MECVAKGVVEADACADVDRVDDVVTSAVTDGVGIDVTETDCRADADTFRRSQKNIKTINFYKFRMQTQRWSLI